MIRKFVSKSLGVAKFNKLKKHVRRFKTTFEGAKGDYLDISYDKNSFSVGSIGAFSKLRDNKSRFIEAIHVEKEFRGRSIGSKLFNDLIRKSRGRKVIGEVRKPRQIAIRGKYQKVKLGSVRQELEVPKRGFKKISTNSVKVRFIRKGGRIIPIRSKR